MKVCILTGTRAEYGLLRPLIDELKKDGGFDVKILATGMHLSPEFGLTYREIEKDGLAIDEKVEMLLSSDTPVGISKAMGLGIMSFSEVFQRMKPDLLIGLGDRFELFSAVTAALVARIPVAHIHGGEITRGAYDEGFRHAITKMSHLHFTSAEEYRRRVIQLGENPKTVFNVGALGIDAVRRMKLLSKKELEKAIAFPLDKPYFVVTFHPVTLEKRSSESQMTELLNALENFPEYKIIFTKPNADSDGRIIIQMIDRYIEKNRERARAFKSLGSLRYLSALKHSEMLIGNSSSGIIEMPYFKKPTVNIGDRQEGRIFPGTVLQCEPERGSILRAVKKGLTREFVEKCRNEKPLFGNGTAAGKIVSVLKKVNPALLIKKEFYDIPFPKDIERA